VTETAASKNNRSSSSLRNWVLTVLLVIAALFIISLLLPQVLQPSLTEADLGDITGKERLDVINARLEQQNNIRGSLLQFFGGIAALFGVGFGAVTAWRQFQENTFSNRAQHVLDREAQLTEQFTHAITYANESTTATRVGGVYALDRFARTSQQEGDKQAVYELLSALVREHSRWKPPAEIEGGSAEVLVGDVPSLQVRAPDVQSALTVLTDKRHWPGVQPLHLPNTDLRKAVLKGANLNRSNLRGAHLEGASLEGANLQGAQLEGAYLDHAHLQGAHLEGANLQGAQLESAHLDGVQFTNANLRSVNLKYAQLTALGFGSDRQHVSFKDAHLQGADLTGVMQLSEFGLDSLEWSGAEEDTNTKWPDEFSPPFRKLKGIIVVT
jgi:hypothetical protein